MSDPVEVIELELIPIPPDTIAAGKAELMPLVEAALDEAGQADLLSDQHLEIQIEKTFPTDEAIIVGLTFLSQAGIEVFKEFILPRLRQRFQVKQKSKRKKKSGKRKK
jgi:hypothetical protein